jgi:hypothetical protein
MKSPVQRPDAANGDAHALLQRSIGISAKNDKAVSTIRAASQWRDGHGSVQFRESCDSARAERLFTYRRYGGSAKRLPEKKAPDEPAL